MAATASWVAAGWCTGGANAIVKRDGSSLLYRPVEWCMLAYIMHSGIWIA